MKLKSLQICLQSSYDSNPGQYVARVQYVEERGTMDLLLDPAVSLDLLDHCAESLQRFSAQAAGKIAQSVQQSVLEARQGPALLAQTIEPAL